MSFIKIFLKRFLIIAIILNVPPILFLTGIEASLLPFYFWVNVPELLTGITSSIGYPDFLSKRFFGNVPHSAFAYGILILFWNIIALLISYISTVISVKKSNH